MAMFSEVFLTKSFPELSTENLEINLHVFQFRRSRVESRFTLILLGCEAGFRGQDSIACHKVSIYLFFPPPFHVKIFQIHKN